MEQRKLYNKNRQKSEMTDIGHLTFEALTRKIVEYMELYYNSERLHSGINYSVPNQFFNLVWECAKLTR